MADKQAWQDKLDRAFPHGVMCSWDRPQDEQATIYRVPWVQVIGMAGLEPVVVLSTIEKSRVLGPERVVTYEEVRPGSDWPDGTVRVTFGLAPDAMFWSPKVPAPLLASMAEERQRLIEQGDQDQGPGVFHPDGADSGVPSAEEGSGP